jgi:DNA-directed RNA polymerase subunit RPC12/RpoP
MIGDKYICNRLSCGHTWHSRIATPVVRCPRCQSTKVEVVQPKEAL